MDSYGGRHIFIVTQKQIRKNITDCLIKICETDSLPFLSFAGYNRAYAFFIEPPQPKRILPSPISTLPNIQEKGYLLWGGKERLGGQKRSGKRRPMTSYVKASRSVVRRAGKTTGNQAGAPHTWRTAERLPSRERKGCDFYFILGSRFPRSFPAGRYTENDGYKNETQAGHRVHQKV
jgi:hypothetical protein